MPLLPILLSHPPNARNLLIARIGKQPMLASQEMVSLVNSNILGGLEREHLIQAVKI